MSTKALIYRSLKTSISFKQKFLLFNNDLIENNDIIISEFGVIDSYNKICQIFDNRKKCNKYSADFYRSNQLDIIIQTVKCYGLKIYPINSLAIRTTSRGVILVQDMDYHRLYIKLTSIEKDFSEEKFILYHYDIIKYAKKQLLKLLAYENLDTRIYEKFIYSYS